MNLLHITLTAAGWESSYLTKDFIHQSVYEQDRCAVVPVFLSLSLCDHLQSCFRLLDASSSEQQETVWVVSLFEMLIKKVFKETSGWFSVSEMIFFFCCQDTKGDFQTRRRLRWWKRRQTCKESTSDESSVKWGLRALNCKYAGTSALNIKKWQVFMM